MPTVPRYDELQVGANALPQARFDAPDTAAIGGISARQTQELGNAVQSAGQVGMQIATDMQQQANHLRVDDALNQVKEEQLRLTYDKDVGFTNIKGEAALKRDGGRALTDEYGEKLQESISAIRGGLSSDAQRIAFSQHANTMLTSFRERTMVHEAGEFKTHSLSVADGVVKTAVDEIGLAWRNPETVANAVQRIEAETYRKSILLGKSGEEATADAKQMISHGHKVAMLTALEQNDPAYAAEYLNRITKAEQITGGDSFAVRGHITQAMDHQVGVQQANQTFAKFAPKLSGSPIETIREITAHAESGGQHFARDGVTPQIGWVTKPDGTKVEGGIGLMQVTVRTGPEAAKLAGLPWDESRLRSDPAYNKALGDAYLDDKMREWGGDPAKMWAAYNAGSGNVRKAIEKEAAYKARFEKQGIEQSESNPNFGKPATFVIPGADPSINWTSFLPKETQNYVTKNLALLDKAQKGGSVVAKPTLQDIHQDLMSNPVLAASPERLKVAMAQVSQNYTDMGNAIKQRGEELQANVQQAMLQNGGRYNDLPQPLRAQVTQYIPGKVDDLMKFGASIGGTGDVQTHWPTYYELATNPKALETTNLMALRDKLADGEFKSLTTKQEDLRQGKGDYSTRLRSTESIVNTYIESMGIKKANNPDEFGKLWAKVDAAVRSVEKENGGKKLNQEQLDKVIGGLFSKVDFKNSWFQKRLIEALPGEAIEVPKAEREKIIVALRTRSQPTTEEAILDLYLQNKGAR